MNARELSRTFDHERGAVVVWVQADGGPVEVHTVYIAEPWGCPCCGRRGDAPGAPLDVEAVIHERIADAAAHRQRVVDGMRAAGWNG